MKYDPSVVRTFYDSFGEKEWTRLVKDPAARVSFHIHRHYLQKYVNSNDSVLEVGAGAGRFTIELANLDTAITVGDIAVCRLVILAILQGIDANTISGDDFISL